MLTFRYQKITISFLLLIIYCCFGDHLVLAQVRYHFYYGKVSDAATRQPIANANLKVERSQVGTVSGKDGTFSFFIDSIPATLHVSFIGYKTKIIVLDQTSFSLNLYLDPGATTLAEVEIKAKAFEPFYKDPKYAVLDYLPDSNLIFILVYRQKLSDCELICKDQRGDTVARTGPLSFSAKKLNRDCLGYLHLLGIDSGFQIFRTGRQIRLIHPVKLKKFNDILKNCVAASPSVLYFKKESHKGLMVEYIGVNRKTLQRQKLSVVMDEKKLKMLRRNQEDQGYYNSYKPPDTRDDFVSWNYANKILYRPIKTALYRIKGYTCIFNIPERSMEFYDDEGTFSYKLAILTEAVQSGRWTQEILTDEITHLVYTSYINNGIITIYKIDLNTGNLDKGISLDHSFPQKIIIHGGLVYYLYDIKGEADNKMLFRRYIQ
ncbi:MAG: carboxypeptidase-like regulatory domain-containing protein [Bacteroidales bacterium]|nr:carboxypeptidase-like regulatory domain-containing protein [Bacteroidales bacterium]HNW72673.1 carboxypeptidase-like regulatory domain-containing protein [Bacteroidales bacterium]HPS49209.1 carboxypeptidase-like regulatory domain-containing protein [Bacteroidales bacterium]